MHRLLILSGQAERYRALIDNAHLPDLILEMEPGAEVDVVFGETSRIKDALASLPGLVWVQSTSAGVETLMDPSLRRDYILTNARNVFGRLMSEYVFGYLLAHERLIFQRYVDQKAGRWNRSDTGVLYGKTLGLLGVGSIGAELARTAKYFEMHVRGFTRESEASPHIDEFFHGNALKEFAGGLDYLVAILPNTAATRKIVDQRVLSFLPSHALFVNVGRGSTVDEAALIEALNENRIAGAVLDVFEQEPLPQNHPLWKTRNVLLTFHTSAPSLPEDLAKVFIENYRLFVEGKSLKYRVDFERGY